MNPIKNKLNTNTPNGLAYAGKLLLIIFALLVSPLFASGKNDTAEQKIQNTEWLLCVTAFDYSGLPEGRRITGEILTKNMMERIKTVNYRLRLSPEYAYYEGYAWQQALNTSAKAIANKYNDRSQLIYRGDPDWKYRNNIKKIDAEIVKLEEAYRLIEAERPLIDSAPVFGLCPANISGTFPAPPQPGGERRFCINQKADAILCGQIQEFHDRYYISLQLFTLYTNSWVYDDDIIFSLEDTEGATEEIIARLTAVLSGNKPASIAVTADPPESQILINKSYAGTGTAPARERPPGNIIVAVAAEGFSPISTETELEAGEQVEIDVTLSPLHYSDVDINVKGNDGAAVYHGALYVGAAPLTLRMPIDQLGYVLVENRKGERSEAVFTSPDMPDNSMNIGLTVKQPHPAGERRVNRARKIYYWGWAGTWITGISAWVTYGIYTSQNAGYEMRNDPALYEKAKRMQIVSITGMALTGAAIVNEIFWMVRYISTSSENAVPIVKHGRRK